MLEMQGLGGLAGLAGFQEKTNCLPLPLNLNLTHYLTFPLAAGKNITAELYLHPMLEVSEYVTHYVFLLNPQSKSCTFTTLHQAHVCVRDKSKS